MVGVLYFDASEEHILEYCNLVVSICLLHQKLSKMASSSSSKNHFDLNEVPQLPSTNVGQPTLLSFIGPHTVGESVMFDDATATRVANNLLTPQDERFLAHRSDLMAINDSLILSIRSTASVSNLGRRLLARTTEVQVLQTQLKALQRIVKDSQKKIKALKTENKQLHKLVTEYSNDMKTKLDELESSGGQIQENHGRLMAVIERNLSLSQLKEN